MLDTQQLNPHKSNYDENILPKGAVLQNRYEIKRVLGVGGMGAVYLSQDLRFTGVERMCAVKEMISTIPDPQIRRLAVQSFEREANLLVKLNHYGIPKIYDFFTESVRSYLVMEYVNGQDLEVVLEKTEGILDEDRVLNWATQVCDVLIYLHSHDPPVIFRDMKPSNIMLLENSNKIALIDFGIAKTFEANQKGTMIGTEGYSPPEQYRGIADPRGDVYALGATLHQLLTKRDPRLEPPFTFQDEPAKLLNPTLSEEANTVIMKALQYELDDRYSSVKVLKKALEDVLNRGTLSSYVSTGQGQDMSTQVLTNSSPVATPPASQPAPVTPPAQYPPPPQQQQYPPPQQQQYPPQQQQQYPPSQQQQYPPPPYPYPYPPPQYPPQYQQNMQSTAALMGQSETDMDDSILPIWKFKCEDEVRGKSAVASKDTLYVGVYDNNLYALDIKTGKFKWKYATEGGIAVKPFLYEDRLIFGSEDRVVYAITTKGELAWTCPTEGRIRSSATVEFDHAFFGSDDHKLYAVNAKSGRIIWKYETMGPVRSTPIMGEELVYVGSEDSHLHAVSLADGKSRWKFRASQGITSSPVVFKDMVIVGAGDRSVYCLDAKSGYQVWKVRTNSAVISSPSIFENMVYIGSTDKNLYAIDIRTGRTTWKFDAETPIVSTPAVTNEAVYFGTSDGYVISLNRKDKKLRWRFKTDGAVPASPLVLDGVVYIGSTDKYVYALPA